MSSLKSEFLMLLYTVFSDDLISLYYIKAPRSARVALLGKLKDKESHTASGNK